MTKTRKWTKANAIKAALDLCGGVYQRAIVLGQARISGADLKGKAASHGAAYKRSREAILSRMTAAGIPWRIETGAHGRKTLVIGDAPKGRS